MRRGIAGDNAGRIWTVEIEEKGEIGYTVTLRSGWGFDALQVTQSKHYESPDLALVYASRQIAKMKKRGYSFWALPETADIVTLSPPATLGDFLHEINTFWFSNDFGIPEWFGGSQEMDNAIQERFRDKFIAWAHLDTKMYIDACVSMPQYVAAVVVLLDQFPRHIYRNEPAAVKFKLDPIALNVACFVLTYFGVDTLIQDMRGFLFIMLPFQHSETLHVQKRGVAILDSVDKRISTSSAPNSDKKLFTTLKEHQVNHMDTILHFGRFPKRRTPQELTQDELEYIRIHPKRQY